MADDWSAVKQELAIWRREGLDLPIWWRDDDAVTQTPALKRLQALAASLALPVHIAVIPKFADDTLVQACQSHPELIPIVHGWAHKNHAPQGDKKAEFGHARAALAQDAAAGLARLRTLFGGDLCAVFVPPWNRIDPVLTRQLATLGYAGLSTYTPRADRFAAEGLVQINTHMDPIHWRAGGGLVPAQQQISGLLQLLQDRRMGLSDPREPLGFLTHHLVHDPAIWRFTETCLSLLLEGGARPVNLRARAGHLP